MSTYESREQILQAAYRKGFEKGAMGSPFAVQKHQADQARKKKKKKPTPGSGAKDISKDYSGRTSQNRNASRLRAAGIDW